MLRVRCLWLTRSDPYGGLGDGACTRIRTRDQLIKSQLLYQLSYAGAPAILSSRDLRCVAQILLVSTPSYD